MRGGQQQIRDVDTCNRQHQRGDGEEQPRQAEVVRRFGNPVAGLRVDHCAPSLVGGRILALHDRCETAQVVARLLDRHGRLQPGEDVDRSRRTVGQEIDIRSRGLANHHPRHVQRRLEEWMHAREPLRRDADDREVDAVEPQRPSDHVAPAAELALPHRVADDDDRTASRCLIVGSGERPAEDGRDAERGEEVAADQDADRDAGLLAGPLREPEQRVLRGGQPLERLRPLLDFVDFRVGETADGIALRDRRQAHDSICRRNRQRTQQESVDEAEDRGGGATAEPRRHKHGERKAFVAPDEPQGVANLANDRDHVKEIRQVLLAVATISASPRNAPCLVPCSASASDRRR